MIAATLRVAGLTSIYLLVLTSLAPGDILIGGLLALALVVVSGVDGPRRDARGWARWTSGLVRMIAVTAWEIAVGTVRVVRFCLRDTDQSGFVEIPRGDRSRHGVALWGVLTGESPDEFPVAIDDERRLLIVHNVDVSDPESIRARHAAAREQHQRDLVP
jgi:multisubunit Na+/H+ antiporter MnhE subunit